MQDVLLRHIREPQFRRGSFYLLGEPLFLRGNAIYYSESSPATWEGEAVERHKESGKSHLELAEQQESRRGTGQEAQR